MKKKILIPYASYGSGHKAIAEYIAKYFKAKDPELEIVTLDLLTYSMKKVGKWSQKANGFLMLKTPVIHDFFYRLFNTKVGGKIADDGSMVLFKNKKMAEIVGGFNPDLTISTHFFGSSLITIFNRKGITHSKLVTVVTDYEAHELWINDYQTDDYIIVGNQNEAKALVKRGVSKEKIKDFGIPIAPMVKDNFSRFEVLKRYNLAGLHLICVFFGGGGNGSTASLPFIKRVAKENQNVDFIYIAGKNEFSKHMMEKFITKNNLKNVRILGYVDNVPELLELADFAISKPGGVQSTECLYFNTPILMINPSGGQEIANYKYFEESGYGKFFRTSFGLSNYVKKISNNSDILLTYKNNMKNNHNEKSMAKMYDLVVELLK